MKRKLKTELICLIMILIFSLILSACGRSKQPEFYILNPLPPQKVVLHKNATLKLGINSIRTPPFAEKPQLLIYDSLNQVQLEEFHQWSESLDKNIKRVIKTNLNTLLPNLVMEDTPWNLDFKPDYNLEIDITEIRMDRLGNCSLRANYIIFGTQGFKKYQRYYYKKNAIVTAEALVASFNQHLNNFSRDIAKTLSGS